jgi:hypothetical protein
VSPRRTTIAYRDDYRPRHRVDSAVASSRERLARLEPGGTARLPIDVESASQIEVRALGTPCLRCDGPYRLDDHTAEVIEAQRVRVVSVHCGHCGAERVFYFRVAAPLS